MHRETYDALYKIEQYIYDQMCLHNNTEELQDLLTEIGYPPKEGITEETTNE